MDSPHKSSRTTHPDQDQIALSGTVTEGGMKFEARLQVSTKGGAVTVRDDEVRVESADWAVLKLAAATSFVNFHDVGGDPAARCAAMLKPKAKKDFDGILADHQADYRKLLIECSWTWARAATPDCQQTNG